MKKNVVSLHVGTHKRRVHVAVVLANHFHIILTKTTNLMRKLRLLFAACALLLGAATGHAKTDVTATYLQDANLASLKGWGNPDNTAWKTDGAVNVVEFWNWSNQFNFSQTANLPAGYYRLAVNAFYRNGGSGDGTNNNMAWIFAGEKKQNVVALKSMNDLSGYAGSNDLYRAATAFSLGNFSNEFDFQVTGEGTVAVEIGFKGTCPDAGWCILGPVTLYEYTAADYMEDYRGKRDIATPLLEEKMNAAVLQALQDAIVQESTLVTVDDVRNAVTTLNAAIANANTSIAYYKSLKAAVDHYNVNYEKLDDAGKAAADAAGAPGAIAAYTNGTATDGDTEKTTLNAAYRAGVLATSQPGDGLDMTPYIVNPSFENGLTGWTNSGMQAQSNSSFEKVGTIYCEAWQPNGTKSVSQAIASLPEGCYRLSAKIKARGVTSAKLYASENETAIDVQEATGAYEVEFLCIGGVTIGYEGVGTGAANSWLCVDDFQLTYVRQLTNDELAAADKAEYVKALAAAQAIAEGTIPAANYAALQQVITTNTLPEGSTAEQYKTAATALNNAATAAAALVEPYTTWKELCATGEAIAPEAEHPAVYKAIQQVKKAVEENVITADNLVQGNAIAESLIDAYPEWLALKANATALVAVSSNNADAKTTLSGTLNTLSNQISTYQVDNYFQALQLAAFIPNANSQLKTAMTTYVTTAEPINDECFDLTFLIVNPHFTEGTADNPTGWTVNYPEAPENSGWHAKELRAATHNFEAYRQQFTLSQTIPSLSKGTYKVTLQGFARHDGDDKDKTNLFCGIVNQPFMNITDEYSTTSLIDGKPALGDNNGELPYELNGQTVYQPNGMSGSYYYFQETNPATNKPFYTNEVQTVITEDGDLTIGFKCETWTDWVIWDNFHLYYYGSAIAVDLDEDTGTSFSEDIENANVTLKKTILSGWNTITIPFDATAEVFGADALYKYTGDDEEGILNFEQVETGEIEPNVPYLLNAPENGIGEYTLNGVTVKAANELTSTGTNYNFVGTYQEAQVAAGDYILGDDAFYRSAGGNKVKAYRAYIKAKSDDPSNARLKISINGVVTAIDTIDGQAVNNATIYNLSGQKVEKAQKGIYIQNGKKVVVR